MGYIVYVRTPGSRFEQWTRKVHKTRAGAIIEMNKGKEKYKGWKILRDSKWDIRKTGGTSSGIAGVKLRMPKFNL